MKEEFLIKEATKEKNLKSIDITIRELIYKKTDMIFINGKYIVPNNLRELIEFTLFLYNMEDIRKDVEQEKLKRKFQRDEIIEHDNFKRFKNYIFENWTKKHLTYVQYKIIKELYSRPIEEKNKYIVNKLEDLYFLLRKDVGYKVREDRKNYEEEEKEYQDIIHLGNHPLSISLGDVLFVLNKVYRYKIDEVDKKFIYAIKLTYSIMLYELHAKAEKKKNESKKLNEYERLLGGYIYNKYDYKLMSNDKNKNARDQRQVSINGIKNFLKDLEKVLRKNYDELTTQIFSDMILKKINIKEIRPKSEVSKKILFFNIDFLEKIFNKCIENKETDIVLDINKIFKEDLEIQLKEIKEKIIDIFNDFLIFSEKKDRKKYEESSKEKILENELKEENNSKKEIKFDILGFLFNNISYNKNEFYIANIEFFEYILNNIPKTYSSSFFVHFNFFFKNLNEIIIPLKFKDQKIYLTKLNNILELNKIISENREELEEDFNRIFSIESENFELEKLKELLNKYENKNETLSGNTIKNGRNHLKKLIADIRELKKIPNKTKIILQIEKERKKINKEKRYDLTEFHKILQKISLDFIGDNNNE